MFLGLRTAIYYVDDIAKGRDWYSALLGFAPYFDEPFYVGFNVGGYELGLQPTEASATDKAAGVVAYWGVENAEAALKTALERGATRNEDVQDERRNQSGHGERPFRKYIWDHRESALQAVK